MKKEDHTKPRNRIVGNWGELLVAKVLKSSYDYDTQFLSKDKDVIDNRYKFVVPEELSKTIAGFQSNYTSPDLLITGLNHIELADVKVKENWDRKMDKRDPELGLDTPYLQDYLSIKNLHRDFVKTLSEINIYFVMIEDLSIYKISADNMYHYGRYNDTSQCTYMHQSKVNHLQSKIASITERQVRALNTQLAKAGEKQVSIGSK